MPIIKQSFDFLLEEAKRTYDSLPAQTKEAWGRKLRTCLLGDLPEDWRRFVLNNTSSSLTTRPTFLAIYLWNQECSPRQTYDTVALLKNPKAWVGVSQAFNARERRIDPLEPLGEPLGESVAAVPSQLNPTTSQKENTMNQFNQTPVAKPTLIFGRVATDMTEQDFFDALEKLEKRKETLEIARGSGSSEYVNEQIQQVNDDISAVIKTMDKVLG